MTLEEEQKIIEKAQKNNKDFDKLYAHYYPKIHSYIYRRINNYDVANDLTSQTFEKAIRRIGDFRWQGISVGVWLYKIARNNLNDYFRKSMRRRVDVSLNKLEDVIVDENVNVEENVIRSEEEKVLYKAIGQFAEDEQFLIYYKFFEDMSNRDIAKRTGLSETNVGTKLHRIRAKMKEIIKEMMNKSKYVK